MKNKLAFVTLSVLTIIVLAAGCAQAAAPAPVTPKPAASDPAPATGPAASSTTGVQSSAPAQPPAAAPAAAATATTPAAGSDTQVTKVSEILGNPKVYGGRVVTVKGKIVSECGSGCWFTLQDGNAVIYIDLAPNNLVIPQKKGSVATVKGEIIREGSDVYMIGSKVDF